MTAPTERCPRCDRAECRMPDIDNRILDDKQRARIRSEHWADCYAATVDWRQRALDEKARADAAEAMLVTYKAAVSRHLQLSMEAILDSTEPVNVALKRADAAEAREAGLLKVNAEGLRRIHTWAPSIAATIKCSLCLRTLGDFTPGCPKCDPAALKETP